MLRYAAGRRVYDTSRACRDYDPRSKTAARDVTLYAQHTRYACAAMSRCCATERRVDPITDYARDVSSTLITRKIIMRKGAVMRWRSARCAQ